MQNQKTKKIFSLQALRGLAFLGVFTSHCGVATPLGAWGVSVFIILSGFVMYLTYNKRVLPNTIQESIAFSIKKIRKLYFLHILMMSLALVLMIKELVNSFSMKLVIFDLGKIILNIFLIQDWIPSSSVYFSLNGVAWYLSLCLFLYFIFPYLMTKIRKIKNINDAVLYIFGIYIFQMILAYLSNFLPQSMWIFDNTSKWFTYVFPLYRLGDFTIGCLLCYLYINIDHRFNSTIYGMFEITTIFIIIISAYIYTNKIGMLGSEWFRYTLIYTLSSSALVYLFAIKKGIITNIVTNKFFIYLGDISAFSFLIHQIIIRYFQEKYDNLFNLNILITWIVTIFILIINIFTVYIYSRIEKNIKYKIIKK